MLSSVMLLPRVRLRVEMIYWNRLPLSVDCFTQMFIAKGPCLPHCTPLTARLDPAAMAAAVKCQPRSAHQVCQMLLN